MSAFLKLPDSERRLILNCVKIHLGGLSPEPEDRFVQAFGWAQFARVAEADWLQSWRNAGSAAKGRNFVKRQDLSQVIRIHDPKDGGQDPQTYETIHLNPTAQEAIRGEARQLGQFIGSGESQIFPGFPQSSVVAKAIWRRVPKGGSIRLGVWPGVKNVTHPETFQKMGDWSECVEVMAVVNPSRKQFSCQNILSAAEFFSFPSFGSAGGSNEIVFSTGAAGIGGADLNGDQMILVGMHIITKEVPDWTWSTYWWLPLGSQETSLLIGKPNQLKKPANWWKHFVGKTSVSFNFPQTIENPNHIKTLYNVIFNPYLEATELAYGTLSSCITCHSRASMPLLKTGSPKDVRDAVRIDAWNTAVENIESVKQFEGKVKTDYLWSLAFLP